MNLYNNYFESYINSIKVHNIIEVNQFTKELAMPPHVTIILLNWNGWKDTLECLESIYQINYPSFSVVLVDNNSTDDSLEKIRDFCSGKLNVFSKLKSWKYF